MWLDVRYSTQSWKILGITVQQTQSDSGPLLSPNKVKHKSMNMYISIVSAAARQKYLVHKTVVGACIWDCYNNFMLMKKKHMPWTCQLKSATSGCVLRVLPCLLHDQFTSTIWFRLFSSHIPWASGIQLWHYSITYSEPSAPHEINVRNIFSFHKLLHSHIWKAVLQLHTNWLKKCIHKLYDTLKNLIIHK